MKFKTDYREVSQCLLRYDKWLRFHFHITAVHHFVVLIHTKAGILFYSPKLNAYTFKNTFFNNPTFAISNISTIKSFIRLENCKISVAVTVIALSPCAI